MDKILVIDCMKQTMPQWIETSLLNNYSPCTEEMLLNKTNKTIPLIENDPQLRKITHEKFTLIAGILPFISDVKMRSLVIKKISEDKKISKQTLRKYLCLYLSYNDIAILCPKQKSEKVLSQDEKNFRWALNKYFYTSRKNSLQETYTYLLKEKYCDINGQLYENYPSFYQFRYFYRKYNKMEKQYISRNGLSNYQRNNRPLLGNGVQEFAPAVGTGMLDSTVCDIYLINDSGNLIGRPILTVCIDAYSSLCCGYSLTLEGGNYSLRRLMFNIISDKVEWCKNFGIIIQDDQWDCSQLPGIFVTDKGSEYKSEAFSQVTNLGITIINLPPYRPELKGVVEKFFDIIQSYFKKILKGKGVINPDFQERGAKDYRKDARLTLSEFEKIIIQCIIFYNSKRIIKNFPYTEEMVNKNILPYANTIFNWNKKQYGSNLISVTKEELQYIMLPRTIGKFTRSGLKVNNLRYHNLHYKEEYLKDQEVIVAFNPQNISTVWLIEKNKYIPFELIENRFLDYSLEKIKDIKKTQSKIINSELKNNLQAAIDLNREIETIANNSTQRNNIEIHNISKTRKLEQYKNHTDYFKE